MMVLGSADIGRRITGEVYRAIFKGEKWNAWIANHKSLVSTNAWMVGNFFIIWWSHTLWQKLWYKCKVQSLSQSMPLWMPKNCVFEFRCLLFSSVQPQGQKGRRDGILWKLGNILKTWHKEVCRGMVSVVDLGNANVGRRLAKEQSWGILNHKNRVEGEMK